MHSTPDTHSDRTPAPRQDWAELDQDAQTRLRIDFGRYLDSLPPTCSLETKIARFRLWLNERGIDYRT